MRRLAFLQVLFGVGIASAQTSSYFTPIAAGGSVNGLPKPDNGICPVCRTVHEAVKRQYSFALGSCTPADGGSIQCEQHKAYFGAKEILVRCTNCSVAFWINTVDEP